MGKHATTAPGLKQQDPAAAARARNARPNVIAAPAPAPANAKAKPAVAANQQQQQDAKGAPPSTVKQAAVKAGVPSPRDAQAKGAPTKAAPAVVPKGGPGAVASVAPPPQPASADETPPEVPAGLEELEASGRAMAEWRAEPLTPIVPKPVEGAFTAPLTLVLAMPPKRAPPGKAGVPKPGSMADADALRQAGAAYAEVATGARTRHDTVLAFAMSQQQELAVRVRMALARIDDALLPHIDALGTAVENGRRDLDQAADVAEATILAHGALARRLVGGAAAGAHKRIDEAAAAAAGQLTAIKSELRKPFEDIYAAAGDRMALSGKNSSEALRSPASKAKATSEVKADPPTPPVEAQAEAKRNAIPPQLDAAADNVKAQGDAWAKDTRERIGAKPKEGPSLAEAIDQFIDALRKAVMGATEGGKTTEPLAKRGHKAVDQAQSQALKALADQVKQAVSAVRHARASGTVSLANQRTAALTRLGAMRNGAAQAMRAQGNAAVGTIAGGARTALPLYADATRRLEATLRETAGASALALSKSAVSAPPPVERSLADGERLQLARLGQVAAGAALGVERQGEQLPLEADRLAQEFAVTARAAAADFAAQIGAICEQQSASLLTAAQGVASSAETFTQPLPKLFADDIAKEKKALDPALTAETKNVDEQAKKLEDEHKEKVGNPTKVIENILFAVAQAVDKSLRDREKRMRDAIDRINMDEDAVMAAFRDLTPQQAKGLEWYYNTDFTTDFRHWVEEQHDALVTGFNDDEYHSIISALNGDPAAAARYELATTVHWYGNENERALTITDALSDTNLKKLTASAEFKPLAVELKGGMYGAKLDIFTALAEGDRAKAEATRAKQQIDAAKDNMDTKALVDATTRLGMGDTERYTLHPDELPPQEKDRRTAVLAEFARLPGVMDTPLIGPLTQEQAAGALAAYATKDVVVYIDAGDAGSTPYNYQLDNLTKLVVTEIALGGPEAKRAKAARILYEGEKGGDDKPDLEQLEGAAVDPRLNPIVTPTLTKAQRDAARGEQNDVYAIYATMAKDLKIPGAPSDPLEARKFAAQRLGRRYDDSEKGRLGSEYVASVVLQDIPDPVVAMRLAVTGAGTDEALVHRTLQRMSRAQIDDMHTDYNARFGEDLFARLGVFGQGSFGEFSGDERLQVERELLGVANTDKEKAEAGIFATQQQLNERGILDINAGSPEERLLLQAKANLVSTSGGAVVPDKYGRPTVVAGNFNAKGEYTGADRDKFGRELNFASTAVDMYTARIDRITSYVTTGIAIIGAIVAAVVAVATGGAAIPLMLVALGAGLAGMGANALMRGGRYGWEEAAVDLAMTAVQVISAGVGAQLGAAGKGAIEAAKEAGASAAQVARIAVVNAAKVGAVTGAIGGIGGAALNERTWENGIGSGIMLCFEGGLKSALAGAVAGAVTAKLENIPFRGKALGDVMQGMTAKGGVVRGGLNVIGRGAMRSAFAAAGGVAGRGVDIGFDTATGRFEGSRRDALMSIGEAGAQAGVQGFGEGMGEAFGQRYHDARLAKQSSPHDERGLPNRPSDADITANIKANAVAPPEDLPPTSVAGADAAAKPPPSKPGETEPPKPPPGPPSHEEGGGLGGPPQGPRPPGSGGGDDDRLFPHLTDAEVDAAFAHLETGPHIRAPADDLQLRLPAAQGGEYWGLDPASRMTVQEYRFRALRGLPPLDAAGNPIAGPLGSRMTRMRIHSPDPTAPAGSASRNGWTASIEQGDLRMTADGRWFDRRFGETPGGRRIPVGGYRRAPTGEWMETATGRRVSDPDVHAALERWDANMAASHIPLFPSPGPGRIPPPSAPPAPPPPPLPPPPPPPIASIEGAEGRAPPARMVPGQEEARVSRPTTPLEPVSAGTAEQAALGIAGARLGGDAAPRLRLPPTTMSNAEAAAERLAGTGGTFEGRMRVVLPPDGPAQITLLARAPHETDIPVKLRIADELPRVNGDMPAARYQRDPDVAGGYIVTVSRGTPASETQRALAHEFAEIRAVHGTSGEQVDALGSGGTGTRLSPHDEGRLAELDVLARQRAQLESVPGSEAEQRRLLDESQRLAAHLGLVGDGDAPSRRRDVALKALAETPTTLALLREAIRTAPENPFLQKPTGRISEDLALVARRLEHARALGDDAHALRLREAALLDQAAEAVMRDQLVVVTKRGRDGRTTYESDVAAVKERRAELPEELRDLFDKAVARAKQMPPLRPPESRAPTPGYEASFARDPAERPALAVPGDDLLRIRRGNTIETLTAEQAIDRRKSLLDDHAELDALLHDDATDATRKDRIRADMDRIGAEINKLSEALGTAAGRRFIADDPELRLGRVIEMPREGAGVPDLLVQMPPHPPAEPPGPLWLVECKGGDAQLGVRRTEDKRFYVQQGRREYLMSLAAEMARSSDTTIRDYGERLGLQLASGDLETRYFLARQPFDIDGNPRNPEIAEFDVRPR